MSGIGEILRSGREHAGLSREEMARTIRVHVTTVAALEEERWGELPASVYVRGFVSSWCRAAGMDPASARDALLRSLGDTASEAPPLPGVKRGTGISVGGSPIPRRSVRRLILAGLLLLAVGSAVTYLITYPGWVLSPAISRIGPENPSGGQGVCEPDAGTSVAPVNRFGE